MPQGSLKEKAFQKIRADIVANTLKPGQSLNEKSLSAKLKISKTPIREAIQLLYKEGFVQVIPQKGCFVSPVTLSDVREIMLIREAVEGISAREAASKCDRKKLEALEEKFESIRQGSHSSYEAYEISRDLGKKLHTYLIESTGNQRLIEIVGNVNIHLDRIRAIYAFQYPPGVHDRILSEHLDILRAVKAGDREKAETLMRTHITNFAETLKSLI
jgi:DNA-binding GntR family transcriptional regulator